MNGADVLLVGGLSPMGRATARTMSRSDRVVAVSSRTGASLTLDAEDDRSIDRALAEVCPRVVVYLPSFVRPDLSEADLVSHSSSRMTAFVHIAREHRVERIVLASSAAVYGTEHDHPIDEAAPAAGENLHARVKLAAEQALVEAAGRGTLDAVVLRIFNVYGPGLTRSLINRLGEDSSEIPELLMSRLFVRDYIHVDDVARAIECAVDLPRTDPVTVNVGTGRGTNNLELAARARPDRFTRSAPTDVASYSVASVDLARDLLGFTSERNVLDDV